MSAQSSGQTPRSSTSSIPSASSSSIPVIRRNKEPGSFDGRVILHDEVVGEDPQNLAHEKRGNDQSRDGNNVEEQYEDRQPRRQKPRTSGGFLLQSSHSLQAPKNATKDSARSSAIAKGKSKTEDGELIVPKRATGRRLPRSAGGSPLASEVKSSQDEHDNEVSLDDRQRLQHTGGENKRSIGSRSSTGPEGIGHQRSALGQDTDPAQIINLALNLSESRRRHVSGATYLMPSNINGGRRDVSGNKQTLGMPYGTSGGSLRQHLRDQRRISRNMSPRSNGSADRKKEDSFQDKRRSIQPFETSLDENIVFNASDATLARAEKARATLELGYEYRRLLRFLPDIPRSASSPSKGGGRGLVPEPSELGRAYNPLQYIRNRKVRFREKRPLNPEIDGWKDVHRVRAWIDTIKSEKETGISPIDDRFPLPPFDAVADQPSVVDSADSPNATQSKNLVITPPSRPKLDWAFAPSDLLADVYWMDQDRNLERIEDRSWQKLIQSPRSYEEPSRTTKEFATSPETRRLANSTKHDTSPERLQKLGMNQHHELERGRRPKSHHQPKSPTTIEDGSWTRRTRWPKKLLRSRSSSSSGQSDWSNQSRHLRSLKSRDNFDNAALEKHMMDMINREAEESRSPQKAMNGEVKKQDAVDGTSAKDHPTSGMQDRPQGPHRFKTEIQPSKAQAPSARQSLDTERTHRRMSSEDPRNAPISPAIPDLAPSIAIDLSPSESSPEPVSNLALSPSKRPFASRLGSSRRDRSRSVDVRSTREDDTAKDSGSSAAVSRQITRESESRNRLIKEEPFEPINGSLAPSKMDLSSGRTHAHDLKSSRVSKEVNSSDSRFRGFFKGGRIAELVGNEVSKVGDIFWKKESSNSPQLASPAASSPNSDTSDDEDQGISAIESSPSDNLSRVTTNNSGVAMKTLKPAGERQKYHMNNLPSFRSRFADTDQSSALAAPLPNEDHIARQQRMMKERGRSFKFDRLAPPRIDMRSVSSSRSPGPSRSQSQDPAREPSRDSSGSRSTRGVRNADRKLNDLLGIPGRVGTGKIAPTGLATFASSPEGQHNRGRPDIKRQWSISDRGISAVRGTITKRDIARVRALLLSSGVKAAEIVRRNDEAPTRPPALLQDLQDVITDPIPLIPASQEIVFAARSLVTDIEKTNQQLRDGAESFSARIVEHLHSQIKAVDERVNYKLTPLVRTAADDADAFSTELTTTHTLAVRQLNDSIDMVLRRRRRRFRWIARGGWAMLEWTVLGLMWVVWLAVVIVRIIRGAINGAIGGMRWLLFL